MVFVFSALNDSFEELYREVNGWTDVTLLYGDGENVFRFFQRFRKLPKYFEKNLSKRAKCPNLKKKGEWQDYSGGTARCDGRFPREASTKLSQSENR